MCCTCVRLNLLVIHALHAAHLGQSKIQHLARTAPIAVLHQFLIWNEFARACVCLIRLALLCFALFTPSMLNATSFLSHKHHFHTYLHVPLNVAETLTTISLFIRSIQWILSVPIRCKSILIGIETFEWERRIDLSEEGKFISIWCVQTLQCRCFAPLFSFFVAEKAPTTAAITKRSEERRTMKLCGFVVCYWINRESQTYFLRVSFVNNSIGENLSYTTTPSTDFTYHSHIQCIHKRHGNWHSSNLAV